MKYAAIKLLKNASWLKKEKKSENVIFSTVIFAKKEIDPIYHKQKNISIEWQDRQDMSEHK